MSPIESFKGTIDTYRYISNQIRMINDESFFPVMAIKAPVFHTAPAPHTLVDHALNSTGGMEAGPQYKFDKKFF